MKIGLVHLSSKVPQEAVEGLLGMLEGAGAQAVALSSEEEIGGVDRLVVLGGDGAMLRAARRASEQGIPLVGINYGTLGFLTEFERGEEARAVRLVLDRDCPSVRRTMLEVRFGQRRAFCLNELALMRRIAPDSEDAVVKIAAEIDGAYAGEFTADGLIVATPTGSTAYSLSAGGMILAPDCAAFLLTPVNAFSMRSRPIAFPDSARLTFSFPEGGKVVLHGDGIFLGEANGGDTVTVTRSDRYATFLTEGKENFFRRLTEKIN